MVNARSIMPLLLLALLLPFTGCRDKNREAYDQAYKANYPLGQQAGRRDGEARGNEEGRKRGEKAAQEAAAAGDAWQLYVILALVALVSGLFVGLSIQYGLLLACRRAERLTQFSTVAFVPSMKSSLAYSIFERRRRVMVEIDEELREMCARKNLQTAQFHEVHDAVARKLQAISSIEELSRARIIELAAVEFERIISNSMKKAGEVSDGLRAVNLSQHIAYACPHCQQIVRYTAQFANRSVNCPNQVCGQQIKLPPLFSGVDGVPLVLDIIGE